MKDEINVKTSAPRESEDSFSMYVEMSGPNGEMSFRHGFPKTETYLKEDENGVPVFINKLKRIYIDKKTSEVSNLGNQNKELEDYEDTY